MTTAEIRKRLISIGAAARSGDTGKAARLERAMFIDVMRAIAAGTAGAAEAQTALQSLSLEFRRVG